MAQDFQGRFVADGRTVDYTPGTAVVGGQVVVQSSMVGVAPVAIAADALGALAVQGVLDVVKVNGAISAGDSLYWDADGDPQGGTAGSGGLTTTAASNSFTGFAIADAAQAAEIVRILLIPVVSVTVHHDLTNAIADPGDAGAIPVTKTGTCPLVSADAETRTLAAPTYAGQELNLGFKTDAGDCVVTASAGVNQTGNNTLTFADAGDQLKLVGIEKGDDKVWRIISNDGVALSTV